MENVSAVYNTRMGIFKGVVLRIQPPRFKKPITVGKCDQTQHKMLNPRNYFLDTCLNTRTLESSEKLIVGLYSIEAIKIGTKFGELLLWPILLKQRKTRVLLIAIGCS